MVPVQNRQRPVYPAISKTVGLISFCSIDSLNSRSLRKKSSSCTLQVRPNSLHHFFHWKLPSAGPTPLRSWEKTNSIQVVQRQLHLVPFRVRRKFLHNRPSPQKQQRLPQCVLPGTVRSGCCTSASNSWRYRRTPDDELAPKKFRHTSSSVSKRRMLRLL